MLRRIFKSYDKKNLVSYSISALSLLLAPLVTSVFTQYTTMYWIAVIATVVITIIFLFLSFNYVDSFHRYFELMKLDEKACLNISAFLFTMSKLTDYNDTYKLKELTIRYEIKEAKELNTPSGKKKLYYPVIVTYRAQGSATANSSDYFFHLLQQPDNEDNKFSKVEYGFTDTTGELKWEECKKTKNIGNRVWQYKFSSDSCVTPGLLVQYAVRIHFDQYAGISELENGRINRFLIYPMNFSRTVDSKAVISSIEVIVPEGFTEKVSKPTVSVFLEGKNPNPNGRQENLYKTGNRFSLKEKIKLKKDVFCAIEFSK